jgi:hypothetical protein
METVSPCKRVLLTAIFIALLTPCLAQAQYDYTTNADGTSLTITGYTGPGGALTIPSNIDGLIVTNIGQGAFQGLTNLTSVTFPDSVTNIGAGAFADCDSLTNLTIPGSVISIGEHAFEWCGGLTNVTMFAGVTSIGVEAFDFCGSLSSLSISASVTNIGEMAFDVCPLTKIVIPGSFGMTNGWFIEFQSVFGGDSTNAAIANGVTNIGSYLFYNSGSLRKITIPSSVTSIGIHAFDGCQDLACVTIPAGVTNIGANAFDESLVSLFFAGNPPAFGSPLFDSDFHTVYYLPGATGWSNTYAGVPAVLWNPQIQASGASFGVRTNHFGFDITGTTNIPIVVEASDNLASPVWTPLKSLTLTNGLVHFSELLQTNSPGRYYRISSP